VTLTPDELRGAVSQTLRQISDATVEIKALMTALGTLGNALIDERTKLEQYVRNQTELVGGGLAETVKSLGSAGRNLATNLKEVKDAVADLKTTSTSLANLATPAQNLSDSSKQVVHEVDLLVTGLKQMSESLPNALDEPIGNMLQASELLAEVVTKTTEHLTPLVSELPNSPLEKVTESIEELRREIDRLRQTAQRQEL